VSGLPDGLSLFILEGRVLIVESLNHPSGSMECGTTSVRNFVHGSEA
jgi:hypothetical protein